MNKTNQFLCRGENVARKPGFRSGFGPSGRVGRAVLEVAAAAGVKVRFPPFADD